MGIYGGVKNKIFLKNVHGDICWWGYMEEHHCTVGTRVVEDFQNPLSRTFWKLVYLTGLEDFSGLYIALGCAPDIPSDD